MLILHVAAIVALPAAGFWVGWLFCRDGPIRARVRPRWLVASVTTLIVVMILTLWTAFTLQP